jgi:hypothetical protein
MMSAAGIAIGGLAIGLGRQRFEGRRIMATNPVSYISYAREKLEELNKALMWVAACLTPLLGKALA